MSKALSPTPPLSLFLYAEKWVYSFPWVLDRSPSVLAMVIAQGRGRKIQKSEKLLRRRPTPLQRIPRKHVRNSLIFSSRRPSFKFSIFRGHYLSSLFCMNLNQKTGLFILGISDMVQLSINVIVLGCQIRHAVFVFESSPLMFCLWNFNPAPLVFSSVALSWCWWWVYVLLSYLMIHPVSC